VIFDEEFNITSITSFRNKVQVEENRQDACSALMFLIMFYCEVIHAIIHVLHLVMVTAVADATNDSVVMNTWAKPYFPNVFVKYEEVASLLFSEGGILVGGVFKAKRDQVLGIAKEIIRSWGACTTAEEFVNGFLLAGCLELGKKQIIKNGILTEFLKHADLVGPYATDLVSEFNKLNKGSELTKVDNNIRLFMTNCGTGVFTNITNMKSWIEVMSITGLMHGGTLSFTRLFMTEPIMALFTKEDKYTETDADTMKTASATIVGMMEERFVFSDQIQNKAIMPPGLKQVITKYAALTLNLKADFFNKIVQSEPFLKDGWALTDFCLDGIDGKQFTLTTYI